MAQAPRTSDKESIGSQHYRARDYCYTPPDGIHAAWSESGCEFLVVLPEPVEILA